MRSWNFDASLPGIRDVNDVVREETRKLLPASLQNFTCQLVPMTFNNLALLELRLAAAVTAVYAKFRRNFRISRRTAYKLIDEFAASPMYPAADHGGSPAKSAEEHLLSFLWYAANQACIRDVAGRFNLGERTLHGMMDRVLDFILSIGPRLIKFPEDLERLSRDFEESMVKATM
ncbi:hypothetical protein HPB47_004420 [Ixodes persulcatus]|uniref:Uncharacterized protein n=1 Tax=Ixodes persulcatus TaxID=34615 RepID=A0AC60PFV6_IXOPE|nr:hypothetical protein HPB47_004420 [Ixodes persulcatus]